MVAVYSLISSAPPFVIDLQAINNDREANEGIFERIQNVALPTFLEYGKVFLVSAGEAFWMNVTYMPETFRMVFDSNIVLGEECMCRLGFWVVLNVIGLVTVTVYLFWQNMYAMPGQLMNYVDPQINPKHIKTKEARIDVSQIPDTIAVETLFEVFDDINFTDQSRPGYINALSQKEGAQTYSVEELRGFLSDNFVRRVRAREAFLGTPPTWNIAQLHQFYGHIEDAVRYALHKVTTDYNDFIKDHDVDALSEEDLTKYNNLLEAKARVAIDLAITGAHCGGRYMGDAMDIYFFHKGEGVGQTLEDDLSNLLAKKREEIAKNHILRYLENNTYDFSAYMANLGGLLGIPGTQNVIERLGGLNDRPGLIQHFFEEYTPEFIRTAVQEKFHSSQAFRERVYDWVKLNRGEWNLTLYQQKEQNILAAIGAIQVQQDSSLIKQLEGFINLIRDLVSKGMILEERAAFKVNSEECLDIHTNWNGFLVQLWTVPAFREKMDSLIGIDRLAIAQKLRTDLKKEPSQRQIRLEVNKQKTQWTTLLENPVMAPVLQEVVEALIRRNDPVFDLVPLLSMYDWISQLRRIFTDQELPAPSPDTLIPCYKGEVNFSQVLAAHLENQCQNEFLSALEPDPKGENMLKTELIEWLLVAQRILNPPVTQEQRIPAYEV